jgi:phosphopantetheinyl transferase (holo-ACP synthase)
MSPVFVGNDVVDLGDPRTQGRFKDERFVSRVLAPAELEAVRTAPDPDLELWCRWAAKEAGFKVVSKLLGSPPVFVHRAFQVVWGAGEEAWGAAGFPHGAESTLRAGAVRYRELEAPVAVARWAQSLHAVAFGARGLVVRGVSIRPRVARLDEPGAPWAKGIEELTRRLTPREADAVHSRASAAVRVGARRALAELLGVEERRLEIACAPGPTSRRPPRVLLDGEETEIDVSLSHDGRWIAWAVCTDEVGARVPRIEAASPGSSPGRRATGRRP